MDILVFVQIICIVIMFIMYRQERKENNRLRYQLELVTEFASYMIDEAGGEEI